MLSANQPLPLSLSEQQSVGTFQPQDRQASHRAYKAKDAGVYRVNLRSVDRQAGSVVEDAVFELNWSADLDRDTCYAVLLESFHVQEPTPGALGYDSMVLQVEMDQLFTNVFDSRVRGTGTTLAVMKGLSFTGGPHLAGAKLQTPLWQLNQINLRVRLADGTIPSSLTSTGSQYVATLLLYPVASLA